MLSLFSQTPQSDDIARLISQMVRAATLIAGATIMGLSLAQPGMEGGPGGGMPGEGMLGMPGMDGPGGEMPGGGGNENHDDAIHLVSQFASSAAAGRAAGSAGPGAAHNSPKDVKPSMEAPPGPQVRRFPRRPPSRTFRNASSRHGFRRWYGRLPCHGCCCWPRWRAC